MPPAEPGGAGRGRPALTSRAAILALVICVIALSLAYPLREYIAQRSEIAELRAENSRTQKEVKELEKRSKELRDPAYIEREARTRLHYQYPGERSYVVVSRDDKKEDGGGSSGSSGPWFTRLLDSVKGADGAGTNQEKIPEAKPPKRD